MLAAISQRPIASIVVVAVVALAVGWWQLEIGYEPEARAFLADHGYAHPHMKIGAVVGCNGLKRGFFFMTYQPERVGRICPNGKSWTIIEQYRGPS